jgi:hypothetical protein
MSRAGCDSYPVNVDCMVPMSEDRQGYLRRLKESSPRLFVSGQERLEVARLLPSEGEQAHHTYHAFRASIHKATDCWRHTDFEHCVVEDIDSLVQQIDVSVRAV